MKKTIRNVVMAVAGVVTLSAGVALAADDDRGPGPGARGGHPRFEAMLERFDTNKDGTLDDAERTVMHDTLATEHFKKLDTNGDNVLTLDEFKAGMKDGPGPFGRRRFGKMGGGQQP